MVDSSLSDTAHTRMIFTKFRKALLVFKSVVKVSKLHLLLRFSRVYIQPTLHSLEFVSKFSTAQHQRYQYMMAKFFNTDIDGFKSLSEKFKWLDLANMLDAAKRRYDQF